MNAANETDLMAEIDELGERRIELTQKIRGLQSQLSDRDWRYPAGHQKEGQRLRDQDFWKMRASVVSEQNNAMSELEAVKADLRAAREDLADLRRAGIATALTNGDVRRLRNARRRATQGGLVLSVPEQESMDRIEDILRAQGGGE